MTTLGLNARREELAQFILQTEDNGLIDKIKRLIYRENRKEATAEKAEAEMTKEEVLHDFDQACKELKLNLEGKLSFKPLAEALNEL